MSGRDGVDEPVGEVPRLPFTRLERFRDGLDDLRPNEHVALSHVVRAGAVARPGLRSSPSMLRGPSFDVDDADLAGGGSRVGGDQPLERIGRRFTTSERVQELIPVFGARIGLRGDGAYADADPGHTTAH